MKEQHSKTETDQSKIKSRKKKGKLKVKLGFFALVTIILLGLAFIGSHSASISLKNEKAISQKEEIIDISESETEENKTSDAMRQLSHDVEEALDKAEIQAMQYDYDAAIDTLNALNMPDDTDILAAISHYEGEKENLVPADMDNITHIFFHTLVVDVERALKDTHQGRQWNAAMTTVPEFQEIIQEMYDRGYVMVHLHDIAEMCDRGDGTIGMVKKQIMLPEGKIPFVMSQDDVNYYIYMENHGFADKIVMDENGKLKNQYTDANGNVSVGDYDLIPILDKFVEEHPGFAYHGHKAIIAVTGYNGVLGYRTDETFDPNSPALDPKNTPNQNIEADRDTVKTLTSALKQDGYEFASHSWGHISFASGSLESIQTDTYRWIRNVGHLLPDPCDILVYPFGADIGDWHPYQTGQQNGKYDFLESVGFRYFCNVDSKRSWLQYGDNFLRQGRRNFDGYRLYEAFSGKVDRVSDLIDIQKVFDTRRPVPINWE